MLTRPVGLRVVVLGLSVMAGACRLARGAAGDAEALLTIGSAAGEPGEEVAIEFRATLRFPLAYVHVHFDMSKTAATFLRTDVEGTAASHIVPRGVIYNPAFFQGGYLVGFRTNAQGQMAQVDPGVDLLLFKAVFRVLPGAVPGEYPIKVNGFEFDAIGNRTASSTLVHSGALTVREPSGPRPVGELQCTQAGRRVRLSWSNTQAYESIAVRRGSATVATLDGTASRYEEEPPLGPTAYEVIAISGGKSSLPARCGLLVQEPRPPAVESLQCIDEGSTVSLSWSDPAPFESIQVFRNGRPIADLPGTAQSFREEWPSDLFTVYSVRGHLDGKDGTPATCYVNQFSKEYVLWAEEVHASPGEGGVAVRIFITNPTEAQGIQVALRIDPALVRIRQLSVDGTAVDAAQYDYFAYQRFYVPGETAAGIEFDIVPPFGFMFPAGADQHCLTVVLDVLPTAASGTVVPVEFGTPKRPFGSPQLFCVLSVQGQSVTPETRNGAILIGTSPVPPVEDAQADPDAGGGGGGQGAGAAASHGIGLRWRNTAAYTSIRIERDAKPAAELGGDATSFFDSNPGPGLHRYRVFARSGALESFPVVLSTLPTNVPGTFLRGDANADGAVNIADAIGVLEYLFRGGREPDCLDGADGDDNGEVNLTDVVTVLYYLFLGGGSLPTPGAESAWFDPTPDDLACD